MCLMQENILTDSINRLSCKKVTCKQLSGSRLRPAIALAQKSLMLVNEAEGRLKSTELDNVSQQNIIHLREKQKVPFYTNQCYG